ncbi:unnamed protein product [Linum trigynum]|uniref:Aminotransferase-like plant mobile domain-containing protein n=1 Tax=Linum trigynum TaxID=586398 RepID=A0AAV2G0T5_9ROSI
MASVPGGGENKKKPGGGENKKKPRHNEGEQPQIQPRQVLRADGFPQFNFPFSGGVASGRNSRQNLERDTTTSPSEQSREYDDSSREYESDDFEEEPLPQFDPQTGGGPRVTTHTAVGVYNDNGGRNYSVPRWGQESGACRRRQQQPQPWELREGCAGGPSDMRLIPTFRSHVAHGLYTGTLNRGVIFCYHKSESLDCILQGYNFCNEDAEAKVRQSGLAHLVDITLRKELDTALISAFIERWQPDTNTFHMPFGEMTILLHDVHHILGVPVDGERMSVDTGEMLTLDVDMCELLGKTKGQISMGAKRPEGREWAAWYNGHGLLGDEALQYVRMHGTASREAQCYLLLLLGSTLFVDKSKDRVKAVVNLFLKNPELVNGYAWGAGALAWLYRQLGIASHADATCMAGCLTLLQCWIYDHFPSLRPSQLKPRDVPDGQPFASRWRGIPPLASYERDNHLVHHYREAIDNLTARQVDWTPYGQFPHIKLRRSLYSGGVISFADVSEVYDPARCLRQFGYQQMIPHWPLKLPAGYIVKYNNVQEQLWNKVESQCLGLDMCSRPCQSRPWEVVEGYMEWYKKYSHPQILSLSRHRRGFVDSDVVLREILTKIAPVLDAGGESREQFRARSDEFYDIIKGVQQLWAEYKQMVGQP